MLVVTSHGLFFVPYLLSLGEWTSYKVRNWFVLMKLSGPPQSA
jgi:hypothetical protein